MRAHVGVETAVPLGSAPATRLCPHREQEGSGGALIQVTQAVDYQTPLAVSRKGHNLALEIAWNQ